MSDNETIENSTLEYTAQNNEGALPLGAMDEEKTIEDEEIIDDNIIKSTVPTPKDPLQNSEIHPHNTNIDSIEEQVILTTFHNLQPLELSKGLDSIIELIGPLEHRSVRYHDIELNQPQRPNLLTVSKAVPAGPGGIFGTNNDDTLLGSAINDIIYGNRLGATAPFSHEFSFTNTTPTRIDSLGWSNAVYGDYAVAGAPFDDTGASYAGSVFVYNVKTGDVLHEINAPSPVVGERFGNRVDLYENYAVISATGDRSHDNIGTFFVYDVVTGNLVHEINNFVDTDAEGDSRFSADVAIFGDNILIGAESADGNSSHASVGAGEAYLFSLSTGNLLHTWNNPARGGGDDFGGAVDISADHAIIGSYSNDTSDFNAGIAYVYDLDSNNLLYTFNNPTPDRNEYFGQDVAIANDYAVVGAYADTTGGAGTGAIYVYDLATGNLQHTINNPNPESGGFGYQIAVSDDYIVVGKSGDDAIASNSGAVYIFDADTAELVHTIFHPLETSSVYFGSSVSIDGNTLVVGAYNEVSRAGAVHVFNIDLTDADVLYGGEGDDTLYGLFGNDKLYGQGGADTLIGGDGSDTFIFEAASVFSGVDTIEDFSTPHGDIIDISDVLTGYNDGVDDIADFVRFTTSGADSIMEIDADGLAGGSNYVAAALIVGGAGLDAATLEDSPHLIV